MVAVAAIHGVGSDEQAWERCDWLWQQPETTLAELCAGVRRIVVVAPHPDDEVLACGGLLCAAAGIGLQVKVVAVTDGEACYPGEAWWTPQRLRHARRGELRDALADLAIDAGSIVHLGIADGKVNAHETALEDWLWQTLREDDLVLAPWRFDGHPDHEAAGRAAWHASRAAGCARLEYPVWGWHWLDPAWAHMAWEQPRLLDISAVAARKRGAIAQFRTQTGDVPRLHAHPILPAHVLIRFYRNHEVYLA
ncbi:PIG-L deacetylase family protein [Stenotrophomonas sp. NPDC077659]|uniref:PIG-L deacetylase family protein n=1 Tax=Stenotrophomonas sp. NPDC077659 TaxID=3390694 RepID=UPI003D041424